MESSTASQSVLRARRSVFWAFAAYAVLSTGFAWLVPYWAGPLFVQALLYAAVAFAMWRRFGWSTWFAVGIAAGGTVIDLAVLANNVHLLNLLDTFVQAGLLALALRARAPGPSGELSLNDGVAGRIGWTFALTVAALPAFAMAAVSPTVTFGCLGPVAMVPPTFPATSGLLAFITIMAAIWLARMRTAGLLMIVVAIPALVAATAGTLGDVRWISPPARLAVVGQLLLLSALLPLGPSLLRALWRR